MSLRDYFAGQALTALGCGEFLATLNDNAKQAGVSSGGFVAGYAYEIADAMIAAKESKK